MSLYIVDDNLNWRKKMNEILKDEIKELVKEIDMTIDDYVEIAQKELGTIVINDIFKCICSDIDLKYFKVKKEMLKYSKYFQSTSYYCVINGEKMKKGIFNHLKCVGINKLQKNKKLRNENYV